MGPISQQDEEFLLDYALGQADKAQADATAERINGDPDLAAAHKSIANALAAVALLPQHEPPAGLLAATVNRVRQHRQTEALIAQAELGRRSSWPTFSMRELGGIAAAVLLMAAVIVPSMRRSRDTALAGQCMSQAGRIGSALLSYANENNDYLPAAAGPARWLPGGNKPAVSNSRAVFTLVRTGMASPSVFQCPAASGQAFALTAGMTDFPDRSSVGYDYQHSVGPAGLRRIDPRLVAVAQQMAILADANPVFEAGRFKPDACSEASRNHRGNGQSVLYLDGHVAWSASSRAGVAGDNIYLADKVTQYTGDEAPASPTDSFLLPAWCGN